MEHLDVLIVGAGLSGIGAGHYLQTECPWATLRHLRGPRRDRRHVGPVPLPGHPVRLRHVHPRLLVPAVGRREVDRRRRVDPAVHQGHRGRGGHRRAHPLQPPHRARPTGRPTTPAGTSPPSAPTPARRSSSPCGFLFSLQRLLPLRPAATCPTSRAWTASAGTIVHPQAWPEDLDYAGKRVVVIGSGATAVTLIPSLAETAAHVTMLQRSPTLHRLAAGQGPDRRAAPRGSCPTRLVGPGHPLVQGAHDPGLLPAQPAPARAREAAPAQGRSSASCPQGYDIDTHFTPRYNPWDQRLASCPTATCSRPSRPGTASVVTDHIDTFTETGICCSQSGDRARGRHHRHRHRARAAVHRRHRGDGRRRGGRPAEQAHLQGHDARGRAEPRPGGRLHERVVDAEVRPHLRLRHPAAQPHARHRPAPVHARQQRRRRSPPQPLLGLSSGYVQRSARPVPEAGLAVPVAGAPELPARLPGAEA